MKMQTKSTEILLLKIIEFKFAKCNKIEVLNTKQKTQNCKNTKYYCAKYLCVAVRGCVTNENAETTSRRESGCLFTQRLPFYSGGKEPSCFFLKRWYYPLKGGGQIQLYEFGPWMGYSPNSCLPFLPQNSTNKGRGGGTILLISFDKDIRLVQNTIFSPYWSILNFLYTSFQGHIFLLFLEDKNLIYKWLFITALVLC